MNAQAIELMGSPGLPIKAICAWLQGPDSAVRSVKQRLLYLNWSFCQKTDGVALVEALEKLFVNDAESREYVFHLAHSSFPTDLLRGRKQETRRENGVGDIFAVDMMKTGSLCITRHSRARIERTTIVTTTDGPKPWDFSTACELDRYLFKNDIFELLARSGLISNEMTCQCGKPMYYDQSSRTRTIRNSGMWWCSGTCKDECRSKRHVFPLYGSWFRTFTYRNLENLALILKAVMVLKPSMSAEDVRTQLPIKCVFHAQDFVDQYTDLLSDAAFGNGDDYGKSYAQRFYEAVSRKYTFDGPCEVTFKEDD